MIGQQMPVSSNAPLAQQAGVTGPQFQPPPDRDSQGKEHRHHHERHGRRAASQLLAGGSTKLILLAIIALLVVAGGAFAFALRSRSPGTTATTPVTTSKGTPATNRNASATSCAQSSGHCSGTGTVTASPTVASGQATGTFNFAGAIPGPMVITSLPQCGVRNGNYFMQVKGTVGGAPFTFLIGLVAYHGPGTYTSNLTVNLIKVGTIVSMNNNGSLPVTITVTSSGKAGMVSSDLEGIASATQPQISRGHVSGSWTCA